jgi:hypothetical protein
MSFGKKSHKMWPFFVQINGYLLLQKKVAPKILLVPSIARNNRLIGENSPNLVTLPTIMCYNASNVKINNATSGGLLKIKVFSSILSKCLFCIETLHKL